MVSGAAERRQGSRNVVWKTRISFTIQVKADVFRGDGCRSIEARLQATVDELASLKTSDKSGEKTKHQCARAPRAIIERPGKPVDHKVSSDRVVLTVLVNHLYKLTMRAFFDHAKRNLCPSSV